MAETLRETIDLQRRGEVAGDHDRIDRFVRAGAMGALAGDVDVEEGAAGQPRAGAGHELPTGRPGRLCMPNTASQGKRSNSPSFSIAWAPPRPSSAGWKMKLTVPLKFARFGEVFRGAQQHGGVAVMAAGMHAAWELCWRRAAGGLLHRQRVHVGAQADRGLPVAVPQHADDAGLADAAMHLDAPFLRAFGDEVGGAVLLQAQFGMGVDVVADGGRAHPDIGGLGR